MSRKLATLLTFAAVCLVGVRSADAQRPGGNARPQFSVVASGENVILVNQREGRTWLLTHSPAGGTPAWVPIQQINSPEDAERWREEQHALAEQREHKHREDQEREMRERLEDRRREMARHREEFEQRARQERELRQRKEAERSERLDSEPAAQEASGARERLKQLGEQTQRAMLESLQKHRQRMVEQFGKDHPAVKSIGEQIERLGRELKKLTDDAQPAAKEGGPAKSSADSPQPPPLQKQADPQARYADRSSIAAQLQELFPLLLKEQMLLETHGPDHPKVKEIRLKIDVTRRFLEELQGKGQEAPSVRKSDHPPESDRTTDTQDKGDSKSKSDAVAPAEDR